MLAGSLLELLPGLYIADPEENNTKIMTDRTYRLATGCK